MWPSIGGLHVLRFIHERDFGQEPSERNKQVVWGGFTLLRPRFVCLQVVERDGTDTPRTR